MTLDMTTLTIMRVLPREVDPLVYNMAAEDPGKVSAFGDVLVHLAADFMFRYRIRILEVWVIKSDRSVKL